MSSFYRGYKIHGKFRMLTIWTFSKKTHRLISTGTCTPHVDGKRLTLAERQAVIALRLAEVGLKLPKE